LSGPATAEGQSSDKPLAALREFRLAMSPSHLIPIPTVSRFSMRLSSKFKRDFYAPVLMCGKPTNHDHGIMCRALQHTLCPKNRQNMCRIFRIGFFPVDALSSQNAFSSNASQNLPKFYPPDISSSAQNPTRQSNRHIRDH